MAKANKILVVDDSKLVRNFHINILKTEGFIPDSAGDGAEALEKALSGDYDLILCDVNMPVMDGITFVEKFREMEKETPIIIITTQRENYNKDRGIEAGANLYVSKPVKPDKLVLNIRMMLGE